MPLEHERAFGAESPVGRYWLRNCVGFHVKGLRGGPGIVEEVGVGSDGVDVLAVRRRVAVKSLVMVPVQRVESVHPWDDTIVLASARRRARERRPVGQNLARRLSPIVRSAALEAARALRGGATVVRRLLGTLGTFLLGVAVVIRKHVLKAGGLAAVLARAYESEARRAWREERAAISAWRESRREAVEEPGDDGPLTRASVDEMGARSRDSARR
jgi:hypothetical protein